jgi:hypothetical protein
VEGHLGQPGDAGERRDGDELDDVRAGFGDDEVFGAFEELGPLEEIEELEELGQLDHASGLEKRPGTDIVPHATGPVEVGAADDGDTAVSGDDPALQRDIDALGAVEAELADVELALRRLDDGSYGRCEVCDATIDDVHLAEAPAARFCRAHLPITLS